jgi:alpha-glucosidase (family GH31 glycosyl hydrolase)
MRGFCALLCALLFTSAVIVTALSPRHELLKYVSTANESQIVVSGSARFTVLTSRLIRMEYVSASDSTSSTSTSFTDSATLAFLNRRLPTVPFKQYVASGVLHIVTKHAHLQYKVNSTFSASTLRVDTTVAKVGGDFISWRANAQNAGQLMGTIRGLDGLQAQNLNCTDIAAAHAVGNDGEGLHCAMGLVSRQGWVLVDDSDNYLLSEDLSMWDPKSRNGDTFDWYLFAHGLDFRGALADFVAVAGRVAMLPRTMTGIMHSRWYDYSNADVMDVVDAYEQRSLPLDVFVFDMNWHTKETWTGYSIDSTLLPDPVDTLSALHARGLATSMNIHDAQGLGSFETQFSRLAVEKGWHPGQPLPPPSVLQPYPNTVPGDSHARPLKDSIGIDFVNKTSVYAFEDTVMRLLSDLGFDIPWIDWQQGGKQGGLPGGRLNPTFTTDKVRATNHMRRGENVRDPVLARWGGLGTHRYQMGFSGDVAGLTWKNMAYQPYFSLQAANVGYGFWSHDIVGPPNDLELHTRWLQFAAYSGALRTHDRGGSAGSCAYSFPYVPGSCWIVEVWETPTFYYEANRAAMLARERLIPYIYTQVRDAYDTGMTLTRGMFFDYPADELAYKATAAGGDFSQYMFGDDIMAAPVTASTSEDSPFSFLVQTSVWIPTVAPSQGGVASSEHIVWYDDVTGCITNGSNLKGSVLTRPWRVHDIPIFFRGGVVVPRVPVYTGQTVGVASRQYTELDFYIYPGAAAGGTSVYEDDGVSLDYVSDDDVAGASGASAAKPGSFVRTHVSYKWTSATNCVVTIVSKHTGDAAKTALITPDLRAYTIRLVNTLPVTSVKLSQSSSSQKATPAASTEPAFRRHRRRRPATAGDATTWSYDGATVTNVVDLTQVSTGDGNVITVSIDIQSAAGLKGHFPSQFGNELSPLSCVKGMLDAGRDAKRVLDQVRRTPDSQTAGHLLAAALAPRGELKTLSALGEVLSRHAGPSDLSFDKVLAGLASQFKRARTELDTLAKTQAKAVNPARIAYAQQVMQYAQHA